MQQKILGRHNYNTNQRSVQGELKMIIGKKIRLWYSGKITWSNKDVAKGMIGSPNGEIYAGDGQNRCVDGHL